MKIIILTRAGTVKRFVRTATFRGIGGHQTGCESIIRSLRAVGVKTPVNPVTIPTGSSLWIPAGIEAAKWALTAKKNGRVRNVLAGPMLLSCPKDDISIFKDQEINVYFVASEWVRKLFEIQCPEAAPHLKVLPPSIDCNYWRPNSNCRRNRVLIYQKHVHNSEAKQYISIFAKRGIPFDLIRYGSYNKMQYKRLLSKARIMVYLGISETAGFALLEAWACGVTTLVKSHPFNHFSEVCDPYCSAPYLSEQVGSFYSSPEELDYVFENHWPVAEQRISTVAEWTRENFSDHVIGNYILSCLCSVEIGG